MADATLTRPAPPSLARLGALAAVIHFAFDSLTRVFTATTPPYLLTEFMDENYRAVFELLGITAVSAVTSCVNGVIAAVFAAALQPTAGRRAIRLSLLYAGIWLLAGGLMALTQLQAPLLVVACSLLCGLPRSAVLGWVMDRRMEGAPGAGPPSAGDGARAPASWPASGPAAAVNGPGPP